MKMMSEIFIDGKLYENSVEYLVKISRNFTEPYKHFTKIPNISYFEDKMYPSTDILQLT